ncbi:hypothetical protein N1851_005002 [Merluccius polli]|uniref:CCHC-type domain-containing protein n=1 Tax=Merluccius polli TaxID=89951 RepID=A0AA47P9H4_MERPO|nr:hypothetical protein N1851_005002 [Merluccius polli]
MDPQQHMNTLAQMLAEVAAMSRDQAVLSRQQLAALQGQAESQTQLLEAMVSRAGAASPAPSFTGLALHKMAAHDDPQTLMEMFEATAAACGWPVAEWAVRLLPLLSGDAQTAALGLPAPSRGGGGQAPRRSPRRSAIRLRTAAEGRGDQVAATRGVRRILEKIVLEQFVEGLPAATSDWVLCHRPADLAGAITLAEDHLAVLSRGRAHEGRPASPGGPTPVSCQKDCHNTSVVDLGCATIPRSTGPAAGGSGGSGGPRLDPGPGATGAALDPQRAPQAAGQECWRCGQLGHFRGECPLMEVGQVIRVVGPPAPSPGPGGTYSVPVRIQGGTHQVMVDSGCMQSIVHQNLIRPGALIEAGGVDIRRQLSRHKHISITV